MQTMGEMGLMDRKYCWILKDILKLNIVSYDNFCNACIGIVHITSYNWKNERRNYYG